MNTLLQPLRSAFLGLATCLSMAGAWASPVSFSGAGTGPEGTKVAARAEFEVVEHSFNGSSATALQITLVNTSGLTTRPEASLTGVYFGTLGKVFAAVDGSSAGFDGLAPLVRQGNGNGNSPEKLSTQVDLGPAKNGSRTDGTYLAGSTGNGKGGSNTYFLTTVETGTDGFSPKDLNYEDFGIIAAGSKLNGTSLRNTAWVDGSATFWIRVRDLSELDLSFIDGVSFSFGADSKSRLQATQDQQGTVALTGLVIASPVPEPSALVLMASALAAFGLSRRRRTTHSA